MNNLIIGNHVSFNKNTQLLGSVKEALSYNANTFMFYTGAPQNTARYEIDDSLTEKAKELMKQNNIDINNVVVHAPYIINLANSKNMDFNIRFLKEEMSRCDKLGINKMVLHPGSHVGLGIDAGIDNIAFALNEALKMESNVSICLETMAGKGSEIGRTFEEIKKIIDKIENKNRIMVCLDTCHLNDAGYNICEFDKVLKEFDEKIGLNKIGCVHINDSKNPISSHKDRHENIGLGTISFNSLLNVIYNDLLKDVPKILETPYIGDNNESKDRLYPPYKFEIEMIRNKKFDINLLENIRNYYK
ncbi:MAG: deoxyribonuclease IV [Firmicutes bacterium]|nr:deoxyribonuclease IV [Bacillota bacterium]